MNQQKSFKSMKLGQTPKITVAIRKRPLNKKELQKNEADIVKMGSQGQVIISEYKQKVDLTKYLEETTFNFDFAYDQHSTNQQIYTQAVQPLIQNAFKGAKITCFAYGQTGSGKTYTMKGDMSKNVPGIYYLGARQIFRLLEQPQHRHLQINVTFYEIYCGKLYDLLNNRNVLNIREDNKGNINVIGLNQKYICSAEEFLDIIEEGSVLRVTSQNNANDDSSRSHAILQISLKEKNKNYSKISFIDLAGNERGADHMDQSKQTKIDGAEINKSLLSLKECIRALDQGKSHTPFRGSKLTMVLKDSFIGYCNTVMICNVSPNTSSSQNTMNTLRYADRVKQLKRTSDEQGERLSKEELMSRELMLPRANNKNCVKITIERGDDDQDIMNKMDMARAIYQNGQPQNRITFQEKMDIQEPHEVKRLHILGNVGKKTESIGNDVKLFEHRRQSSPNKSKPILAKGFPNKGRDLTQQSEKQPLLSRNVQQQLGQNNINSANGSGFTQFDKRNKLFVQNAPVYPQQTVNKVHFEAMSSMRNDFMHYRENHQMLFNREMALIKEEMSMKNEYREMQSGGANYQEQIENVSSYLKHMEKLISQKEEILNIMRANVEKMKFQVRNAEGATSKLRFQQANDYTRQQQSNLFGNNGNVSGNTVGGNVIGCRSQTKLYVHSSMNGMQFSGFNNYGNFADEQLLEGLPGDETINRLF